MAITEVTGERVPPAAALRALIAAKRRSPMAFGLGEVLEVVDAYVAATESRIEQLEARLHGKG